MNGFRKSLGRSAVVLMLAFSGGMGGASAALLDRGNGLVYDDVENISWTRAADLSGLGIISHPSGDAAITHFGWADRLELGGYTDFRLSTMTELLSLFNQLPGDRFDKTGDTGPFTGIHQTYSSSTTVFDPLFGTFKNVSVFFAGAGSQNCLPTDDCFDPNVQIVIIAGGTFLQDLSGIPPLTYAWAVREGDSVVTGPSPVPEPATRPMLLAGLALLAFTIRTRRNKKAR